MTLAKAAFLAPAESTGSKMRKSLMETPREEIYDERMERNRPADGGNIALVLVNIAERTTTVVINGLADVDKEATYEL
ncbi:hypothetical protein Q1695_007274 [Nippostrongylus brasiliensis]|nr:hypothetical protein Q1695_007274 [Nippostrongylus brasiliensis]